MLLELSPPPCSEELDLAKPSSGEEQAKKQSHGTSRNYFFKHKATYWEL